MSRIAVITVCGMLALGVATRAQAQVKVIPGDKETVSATIEAIESSSRTVIIRTKDGVAWVGAIDNPTKRHIFVGDLLILSGRRTSNHLVVELFQLLLTHANDDGDSQARKDGRHFRPAAASFDTTSAAS